MLEHSFDIETETPVIRTHPFRPVTAFLRRLTIPFRKIFYVPIPQEMPHRYVWSAALLSMIPPLGQIYNGQPKKGAFFVIIHIVMMTISILTITQPYSNYILYPYVLFILYTFGNGFATASVINGVAWTWRKTLAVAFFGMFAVASISILSQFFFSPIVCFFHNTHTDMYPRINNGDRFAIENISYWFGEPRRGDIILYNPEAYSMYVPLSSGEMVVSENVFRIRERRTFGIVSGIPGDVIERIDGAFYLNGEPMPENLLPFRPENLWENLKLEAPENKYIVIISQYTRDTIQEMFGVFAPKLNDPGVRVEGWDEACLVEKKQIGGRIFLRYQPPERRCFFSRVKE